MTSVPSTNPLAPITEADLAYHNIQGLIELSYVKTANDVLFDSLSSLQTALNLTTGVMNTLTGLQNLHNKLVVSGKGTINFNYQTGGPGGGSYTFNYSQAASAFFGQPIVPQFAYVSANATVGTVTFAQFQQDLINYRNQLIAQIPQLSAATPTLSGGGADPNALLSKIRTVLADLNQFNLNTFSGVQAWVLDSYDSEGADAQNAGNIQKGLTFAITAGQALNNTQSETVRRYLFLFEEYYKSASTILQAITQIIQKMAGGITTT